MREVKDETGLQARNLTFRGIVTFVSDEWGVEYMYLFSCEKFDGKLIAREEGSFMWLSKDENCLTKKMWTGNRIFLDTLDDRTGFFVLKSSVMS